MWRPERRTRPAEGEEEHLHGKCGVSNAENSEGQRWRWASQDERAFSARQRGWWEKAGMVGRRQPLRTRLGRCNMVRGEREDTEDFQTWVTGRGK